MGRGFEDGFRKPELSSSTRSMLLTARTHCAHCTHASCTLHARIVLAACTHALCLLHARTVHTHALCTLHARILHAARTHCARCTHARCTLHARTHCAHCRHALCTLHARILHTAQCNGHALSLWAMSETSGAIDGFSLHHRLLILARCSTVSSHRGLHWFKALQCG